MAKKGTSPKIAKIAAKVLNNPKASKAVKTVAGSANTQSKNPKEQTSAKVAKVASKILRDGRYGKDAKTLAGSVLGQKE
jgi:hypothetical protein